MKEDLSPPERPIRVLFVCLGNICRSPLAEGVFRDVVQKEGLEDFFEIDSGGTGAWHVGERPDPRMRSTANRRGLDISYQRARQVERRDLLHYDHIFVMDEYNRRDTLALDPAGKHDDRVRLFREFDPEPDDHQVPDPYSGGPEGFEHVFDIVERTSRAILDHMKETYDLDRQPAGR